MRRRKPPIHLALLCATAARICPSNVLALVQSGVTISRSGKLHTRASTRSARVLAGVPGEGATSGLYICTRADAS